jgi:hypothetical protein
VHKKPSKRINKTKDCVWGTAPQKNTISAAKMFIFRIDYYPYNKNSPNPLLFNVNAV